MEKFSFEDGLIERIRWLIRLRWVAVTGVILTVLISSRIFKFVLPVFPLYTIALLVGSYNLLFLFLLANIRKEEPLKRLGRAKGTANLQIFFDLASLAALIHFSGGIENPFIFYFIFHMIIASILLSRRASFLQATFAVTLFCFIVILEYFGIFSHYCLKGFIIYDQHKNLSYIFGVSFVFITTLYIAVYMATSIAKRLRERENQLKQANELLEEKDRIKSEYVLRVTHDIKEHLSSIQACIEPVTAGITGVLNEKQKALLDRAEQRTEKLMFFVKALLEITRIKLRKHIKMDYFSLPDTVESAINFVDAKAKDKNIIIGCEIEPAIDTIRGAQVYIEETIANILANSVKYTPKNGKINILVKDEGAKVLIQIMDTGIGIPRDEISRLFQEFYRASNAREIERSGTGLGLSIAKQVVEMHNGKIWVESQEGKGSTFSIELPK